MLNIMITRIWFFNSFLRLQKIQNARQFSCAQVLFWKHIIGPRDIQSGSTSIQGGSVVVGEGVVDGGTDVGATINKSNKIFRSQFQTLILFLNMNVLDRIHN